MQNRILYGTKHHLQPIRVCRGREVMLFRIRASQLETLFQLMIGMPVAYVDWLVLVIKLLELLQQKS